jgi:Zn-dependent peptidase ImmA (M78 family)/DNA-binding XRE family transcriptional regulator
MGKINHRMIQLARESRGYTQTELAEKLIVPQGNLSRMERGDIGVKDEHLQKLSEILKYPIDFFYSSNQICTTDTHYRKRITIDQRTKLKAEALMNIYKFNVEEMLKSLEIRNNIPTVSQLSDSPEKVAQYLRSYWKIQKGSIDNLSKIVEENGVIVIQVDFETDKIDGRTIVTDTGHPIIFLNSNVPGDRQRLTLAHELGHVVLPVNSMPLFGRDEEDEAFRFAIEFLMPLHEVEYDLNDRLSIEKLADLKRIYKVSLQAILYRGQKQNLVNYNRCRYLWSQISSRGWRRNEPIEIAKETPTLVGRMAKMFIDNLEYSKEDLAKILRLNFDEMDSRYFTATNKLRVA